MFFEHLKKHISSTPILWVVFLLLFAGNANSQSVAQLAVIGQQAYNNRNYSEAIKAYEKIIASGKESAEVYYNLGNAYFRVNKLPLAIYNYEKALKWAPNNSDIAYNIELCNAKIEDKIEKVPELFYARWWNVFCNMLNINTIGMLSLVLFAIALLFVLSYIRSVSSRKKKISFWGSVTFIILFTLFFAASLQRRHNLLNSHEAIVFEPVVNAKSSPDENSKNIFVVHEGTKVMLGDIIANWQEIRLANGSVGWIKSEKLKKI